MAAAKKKKDNTVEIDQRQPHPLRKPKVTEYPVDITDKFEELEPDVIAVKEGKGDYTLVAKDPFGHYYIEGPKVPAALSGAYTTYQAAKAALDGWLKK